jgi:hypothetical protein
MSDDLPTPRSTLRDRGQVRDWCRVNMKILFVLGALALVLSGCASVAAYEATHPYYRFPGGRGAGGGANS